MLDLGHELRSPLSAILCTVELLERQTSGADEIRRREQLKVIRSAVEHAEALLRNAQAMAAVPRGPASTEMKPLGPILESGCDQLALRADAAGVSVVLGQSPADAAVEAVVAHTVLANLLSNAIKYADPSKHERWVRIRTETAGNDRRFVMVEVADNGVGIAYEHRRQIFERRVRFHPQMSEGSGLGLAITHRIVTERGGRIELRSEMGAGTTVRVWLPAS